MVDFNNKDSLNIPWTMSPFFEELLEKDTELTEDDKEKAKQFYEEGYLVIDLGLSDLDIEQLKQDVVNNLATIKKQEEGYHYSDSPRVFEGWKFSKQIASLACNETILKTLEMLYARAPFPFQTINFIKGSNQPLHSDFIHFGTIPNGWVAAVWVALEDMDEENGTLVFCPKSHREPFVDFKTLNLQPAEYGKQFENYAIYEKYIEKLASSKYEKRNFVAKKGSALIWAANLLHGGLQVKDNERTRWSQATHYYFDKCEKYYVPMFSDPNFGRYSEKNLAEKNILEKHRGFLTNE